MSQPQKPELPTRNIDARKRLKYPLPVTVFKNLKWRITNVKSQNDRIKRAPNALNKGTMQIRDKVMKRFNTYISYRRNEMTRMGEASKTSRAMVKKVMNEYTIMITPRPMLRILAQVLSLIPQASRSGFLLLLSMILCC